MGLVRATQGPTAAARGSGGGTGRGVKRALM